MISKKNHITCSRCPPFLSMHFFTRRVKWSITRLHWSCETASTPSTMAAFRSSRLSKTLPQSLYFKNPHRWKSRGLKSGLLALHGCNVRRLMHLLLKWLVIHCRTCLATWGAAPSCWNHWWCGLLTPVIWRSFVQNRDKMSKYRSLFTVVGSPLPSSKKNGPIRSWNSECIFDETTEMTRSYYMSHNFRILWRTMMIFSQIVTGELVNIRGNLF